MKLKIRRAAEADAFRLAELEAVIFSDGWSQRDVLSAITENGAMCYVGEAEGDIVCYLIGRKIPPEAEIYRVATAPMHRRRGYSRELIRFVLEAESDSACDVYLEVRESNVPARRLYGECGFSEISVRKNYYKNPTENGINMHKGQDNENTCV